MKNRGIHFLWGVAWLLGGGIFIPASAQSARVAVAGEASLANLIDVTTVELSKTPELGVMDRADLDKLGQERALQSVLAAKDFSPIRLLPVDGLVLLRAVAKNGKSGVFARLVAVQPGVVLREVALPDNADPSTQAQALTHEFAPYWAKLAAIQKGGVAALSLLGLRFDVDSPETRDLERSINLLLASRLSAEPDILVLERWRLNDAVFEKSLAAQQASPFWTGSSLIDGGLRLKDHRIEVTLRMRPPHGPEVSMSDQDAPENLPALVERLAGKIHDHPLAPGAWKPVDEAAHFAQLGKWCLDNRLYDEGAEALESAVALGDTSRTTHMLQVKAYAMGAYPDPDLRNIFPSSDEYRRDLTTADSMPQRVLDATRAAHLMQDYMTAYRDFTSPKWNEEVPVDLGVPVLYNCLRTQRAAYDHGWAISHPDETANLRHEVHALIDALGAVLLPQPASLQRGAFLNNRAFYAGLWHDKPEETLRFYREILTGNKDGAWMRSMLFQSYCTHEPYLDGAGEPFSQNPRSIAPPWIAAYDGRSPDDVKTLWQNFLKELATSSDPVLPCDAFKFEIGSNRTVAGRNEVQARFITFLQPHADSIAGPRGEEFVAGFDALIYGATGENADPTGIAELTALYAPLFKRHVLLPSAWINEIPRLFDDRTPTETVKGLLDGLNDYSQWCQTQAPQSYNTVRTMDRVRQEIYRAKPELIPAPPAEPPTDYLAVNHLWDNRTQKMESGPNPNDLRGFGIENRTLTTEGNTVWFMAEGKIYGIDSTTFQVVSSVPFPDKSVFDPQHLHFPSRPAFFGVTPQWLVVGLGGQVMLCSRSDNQWRTLDLPLSYYKPVWVNQQLYLLYDAYGIRGSEEDPNGLHSPSSGLIRVSLPEGTTENLVSSRRIPPQSALDGKALGVAKDLWLSQAGLTMAFDDPAFHLQVYAAPLGTNNWSLLTSDPSYCHSKVTAEGAVIGTSFNDYGFFRIIRIDQGGARVLLSNPANVPPSDSEKPEWNCPEDIRTMVSPVMRGDDLCLLYEDRNKVKNLVADGTQCALYYLAKGQKDGVKIPLAFDFKQMKGPAKVPKVSASFEDLHSTDYGLIVEQPECGFWAIPWSEIDAYRAKAHSAPAK